MLQHQFFANLFNTCRNNFAYATYVPQFSDSIYVHTHTTLHILLTAYIPAEIIDKLHGSAHTLTHHSIIWWNKHSTRTNWATAQTHEPITRYAILRNWNRNERWTYAYRIDIQNAIDGVGFQFNFIWFQTVWRDSFRNQFVITSILLMNNDVSTHQQQKQQQQEKSNLEHLCVVIRPFLRNK